MQLITVKIEKPDATNFILGQTHFIKTVEDIHETLVGAVAAIKFGLAFCEASGKCLVRRSGTDPELEQLASRNAMAIGAGHCFILFLGEGYYPINVLNAIKNVPEVCRIFCATANPTEVIIAETDQGRGVLGVVDGFRPQGIEEAGDIVTLTPLFDIRDYLNDQSPGIVAEPIDTPQEAEEDRPPVYDELEDDHPFDDTPWWESTRRLVARESPARR